MTMNANLARRGELGFTLMELLIGLAIVAMVTAALVGGVRFSLRAWETGHGRADDAAAVELAQNLLRRQLTEAVMVLPAGAQDPSQALFRGAADRLEFAATLPAHAGWGGLYRFALTIEDGDLVLAWRLHRPDGRVGLDGPLQDSALLLEDVEAIDLAYFGNREPGDAGAWRDDWDNAWGMPDLIRLNLLLAQDDRRVWRELIVAPRLQQIVVR